MTRQPNDQQTTGALGEARPSGLHVEAETVCEPAGRVDTAPLQLFWAEVTSSKATSRSLAVCYALLIAGHAGDGTEFWRPINQAVNSALGLGTLRKVDAWRRTAWAIHDAAASYAAKAKDPAHDR